MNCTTYKQLILFYMHSNQDFVVLPLKTKNCIFPKADSKKNQKKKEKGNATNTFFTSISLVLSNEKQNRITVPIKLAKLCLLFIKFAKVQSIYSKSKASCLLAAKQLQRTPYDTEWWLIRGTFRWSIVNGGFHMHVAKIIYLIAIWVYKSYIVVFGRKDGFNIHWISTC